MTPRVNLKTWVNPIEPAWAGIVLGSVFTLVWAGTIILAFVITALLS